MSAIDHKRITFVLAASIIGIPSIAAVIAVAQIFQGTVRTVDWVLLIVFYVISLLGVEGGMHRYFSHKAFQCSRPVMDFLAISG